MKPLPLNISNDALTIIIGIATLIIGLTGFGIEFGENKYLKFAKSRWFRIPTLVLFSLIIMWASVVKDRNNDVRNSNGLRERDSTNQINFNKSLSQASAATSIANAETMAKYYLKYDSAQHKIENLVKDSVKSNYIKPEIDIGDIKSFYKADSVLIIAITSAKRSIAYDLDTHYCIVLRDKNNNLHFEQGDEFKLSKLISPDSFQTRFKYCNSVQPWQRVYFYTYGTFKDEYRKQFRFKAIKWYDLSSMTAGFLNEKESIWIMDFIKKNNG